MWLGLEGTVVVGGGLVIWLCRGLGLVIVVVGGRQGTLSYGGRGTAKLVVQGKVLRRDAELEREAGEERQERVQFAQHQKQLISIESSILNIFYMNFTMHFKKSVQNWIMQIISI